MAARRTLARSLAALAVGASLVLATGQGAYAASKTVRDATGDVYSLTGDSPTKVSGPDGDITSVTTMHGRRKVRIKVRARHLSLDETLLFAKIRTGPTGPAYFFSGTADIGVRIALIAKGQTHLLVCPGIRMAFHASQGYVMAVIPRTCLGSPRWIRVGAALATTDSMVATLADENYDPFADDSEATGTVDIGGVGTLTPAQMSSPTIPLPLGPKVRVG
ncbi:hypothetical protein [Nocardioides sp. CER19]|uniref:hypothetical protein n=1 Tax=Nocardioides sp. CER19 TaxID=3038538 RepID=UPI0024495EDC|nr:hypothetical protein [Nocardioides sp. CER19]MDH2416511.1 hypothetical protein [Nocardioides sp. CER19]